MKALFFYFTRAFVLLIVTTVLCFSCKEDDPDDVTPNETGLVTEIGRPEGTATTKVIDAAGGSIETPDGQLKVEIPAGALSSSQSISIQPITTTNKAGLGTAYRLTPHDVTFSKPVKITFAYTDDQIKSTVPEALGIAYQNEKGVWMAIGGVELDKAGKRITVPTTHFSDWSFFESVTISPQTSSILADQSVDLKLSRTLPYADLLEPLVPGKEYPITDEIPLEEEFIKGWSLAGEGQLNAKNATAKYTAPSQVPSANPVTVSVKLDLPGPEQLLLLANIRIVEEGITFRINGGPWIKTDAGLAMYFPKGGYSTVSGYVRENGEYQGDVEIVFPGAGPGSFSWSMLGGVNFMYTTRGTSLNIIYYENYSTGTSWANSPGSLVITQYGNVLDYVSGRFYLEKAGIWGDGVETTVIEGNFTVKRVADN